MLAKKELAPYVVFEQTRFEDIQPSQRVQFRGNINLPSALPPGNHRLYICASEDCPEPGMVCGRATICANWNFLVLYPGILPQVSFKANNANKDQPVDFVVSVKNLGTDEINQCSGYIRIFDFSKKHVGTAFLESKPVPSNADVELNSRFNTKGLLPGNFSATAFVDCDGEESVKNASFRIGTLNVMIVGHTKELEIGGIKRFITTVESAWNDPLNVYTDVSISNGEKGVEAKTATYQLKPWSTLDLEAFIDTDELDAGRYDVSINAYFAEKTSSREGKIDLVKKGGAEPAAAIEEQKPSQQLGTTAITLVLIVVVLVLTGINIFLALRNKKKR